MSADLPGAGGGSIRRPRPGIDPGARAGTGEFEGPVDPEQQPLANGEVEEDLPRSDRPIIKPDNWSNP